jgi:hypothetical protein
MKLFVLGQLLSLAQCQEVSSDPSVSAVPDRVANSRIEEFASRRAQKKAERNREKIAKKLKRLADKKSKQTTPKVQGNSGKENSVEKERTPDKYKNDQRIVNTDFIQSFITHNDKDDILYNPNYAVFMAKSGANVKDIPIELTDDATARAAGIPGIINLWDKYIEDGTGRYQVPYAFEPKFDEWGRKVVRQAFDMIEKEMPCITFVDANPRLHRDYIYMMQSRGCHSYVGRIQGAQPLYLDIPCQRVGVATHEIFHALGFHHEHQRVDRDKYIRIQWENIKSTGCGAQSNVGCGIYFQKLKWTQAQASRYDYRSVMHYDGFAFSSKPGVKPTIVDKAGQVFRAQRVKASTNDMRQLCGLYSCSKCDALSGSKPSACDTPNYSTYERRRCD